MYAIVEINGQQFKAEAGKKLFVHHMQNAEAGATVEFEKVLLVDKDGNITTLTTPDGKSRRIGVDVIQALPIGDYNRIRSKARTFLLASEL